MARSKPETQTVKSSEARQNWSKLVNRVYGGDVRLLVEKDGIPVAGIISATDLKRLAFLEAEREGDFAIVDEVRDAFSDVPADELEREIGQAIAEVREEIRAERRAKQHQ